MKDGYRVGIDVGTTSVKASLLDAAGRMRLSLATPVSLQRPATGHVEQDPNDWWIAILAMLERIETELDGAPVDALGLTSQVNTHLFVDDALEPLGPAIVWQDTRTESQATAIDREIDPRSRRDWWGAPLPIDTSHVLARTAWLAEREPDRWRRCRHVLLPKDWCLAKLVGEIASDPLSNIGAVDAEGRFIDALFDQVPGSRSRLPELRPATDRLGPVRHDLPLAGTPVAVGTMDAWAGMLGTGACTTGQAVYLSGTSDVLGILSDTVEPTPGVLVMPRQHGLQLHVGPTQSGGAARGWLADLLNSDTADLSTLAAAHEPGRRTPLFLPHLEGERAPLWDPHARGLFLGLDSRSDAAAIAYAVFEGVALSGALLFETLVDSAGSKPTTLRCGGGGFRCDTWSQIRADTLGVTLERVANLDVGTVGAAGIAAVATGAHDDLADAMHTLVRVERRFEARERDNPARTDRLDLYREAYEATAQLSRRWSTA